MYQAVYTWVLCATCVLSVKEDSWPMLHASVCTYVRTYVNTSQYIARLCIDRCTEQCCFFLLLKEFAATKEEKKAFLDQANAEFDALMADPSTKDLVPAPLAAQHDLSNKHWEDLCKRQDMEEQAEQVCVCVCVYVCMCA